MFHIVVYLVFVLLVFLMLISSFTTLKQTKRLGDPFIIAAVCYVIFEIVYWLAKLILWIF